MSDHSPIEWTDATWNPVTGCTKVSPGCAHCYIERQPPFRVHGRRFVKGAIPVQLHPQRLEVPLRWRTPKRIFVNGLSDLYHDDVDTMFIAAVFDTMRRAHWHQFQVLTKRSPRLRAIAPYLPWPPPGLAGRVGRECGARLAHRRFATRPGGGAVPLPRAAAGPAAGAGSRGHPLGHCRGRERSTSPADRRAVGP